MREKWIDNAKGIAILLVILAHVNDRFSFAYGFHLVVFFVLSGYTAKTKPVNIFFLKKKFNRLMTPYFITCFMVTVMDVINCRLVYHDNSIKTATKTVADDLIRCFFGSGSIQVFGTIEIGTRIGAIWFLPALFFALLLHQLLLKYIENDIANGIASIGLALLGMISAKFIWLPFSFQSGMFALPFIWIGYGARKSCLYKKLKRQHFLLAQIILIIGIRFGYCTISFATATPGDVILSPIVGLSGCMMVCLVANMYKGKGLEWLGRQSLVILCAHLFALETLGEYFKRASDCFSLTGELRNTFVTIIHLVFPIAVAMLINVYKSSEGLSEKAKIFDQTGRDNSIDTAKGILILMMVLGHYSIDSTLRAIIFSCHMAAFVTLSGYFYNTDRPISTTLKRMTNTFLKPYAIAASLAITFQQESWDLSFIKTKILQYLIGMSFSKKVFTGFDSVGPIYFILLLFTVRLLYMAIDLLISKESTKWAIVLVISLAGVLCGIKGYWLPWSMDVACYALVFYKIGLFLRENDLLSVLRDIPALYFILAPIWAYMIYSGSMELAIRNYGQYGLAIIGAVCGTLLVYMLSSYIWNNTRFAGKVLAITGKASLYVLIAHTVLGGVVSSIVTQRFDPAHLPFMVVTLTMQLLIALLSYGVIKRVKSCNKHS